MERLSKVEKSDARHMVQGRSSGGDEHRWYKRSFTYFDGVVTEHIADTVAGFLKPSTKNSLPIAAIPAIRRCS